MDITKVKISLTNERHLRAFADITLDDCFVIRSLRIIVGPNGLFVAPPRLNCEKDTQLDIAQPLQPHLREMFEGRILAEYRKVDHNGDDGD